MVYRRQELTLEIENILKYQLVTWLENDMQ